MDAMRIEQAILAGHSLAGIEMPRFAVRYPHRVEAIMYLDGVFPRLDPEPDLSDDPAWSALPTAPTAEDLASCEAYLAYYRRARPDWARIWCEAIEANVMEYVTVKGDGCFEYHHDEALMNRIAMASWPSRDPEYGEIQVPMLAVVPDGHSHPGVPLDAPDDFRHAADRYWEEKVLPWIRQRTEVFCQVAPSACVVELDSPNHHILIAKEDETVSAILDFVASQVATCGMA